MFGYVAWYKNPYYEYRLYWSGVHWTKDFDKAFAFNSAKEAWTHIDQHITSRKLKLSISIDLICLSLAQQHRLLLGMNAMETP